MTRGSRDARIAIAALAALFFLVLPSAAFGQVQTVTANVFTDDAPSANITAASCTPDHCTLREALWPVAPARIVQLLPGRYELAQNEPLGVNGVKTINGRGATIDANGLSAAVAIVEGADAIINDVTITGGNADAGQSTPQSGGGIGTDVGTTLTLNRSTVAGNRAGAKGGGIFNGANNALVISNSTISGNTVGTAGTGGDGAGIYSGSGSDLTIVNSTISGNQTVTGRRAKGAGIAALGSLDLQHVTIAANVAPSTVGSGSSLAIAPSKLSADTASVRNTIVVADTGAACHIDPNRTRTGTNNLSDDTSCGFTAAGDKQGVNALLGPLRNNGGATRTHALSAASPAIGGAGPATCARADQRGVARPQGGTCDIGATEYVAPVLTVVTNVVNDHGFSDGPEEFRVQVHSGVSNVAANPRPGSPGTAFTLKPGGYVVTVDARRGYTFTVGGACLPDGRVTLAENQRATCRIVANDPSPQAGLDVNALPKSGIVRIKLPGSERFRRLREGEQLPNGTIVDTRKGRITLIAAADQVGNTATADFYGGIFRIKQSKGNRPTTTLRLVEALACSRPGQANAAATRKRKRRLWGNGSGRFRTRGRHSAATVVGTKWLVEDRCTSTLTRVVRGRVSVRDFVKKKTVIVRKGKRYVARAR